MKSWEDVLRFEKYCRWYIFGTGSCTGSLVVETEFNDVVKLQFQIGKIYKWLGVWTEMRVWQPYLLASEAGIAASSSHSLIRFSLQPIPSPCVSKESLHNNSTDENSCCRSSSETHSLKALCYIEKDHIEYTRIGTIVEQEPSITYRSHTVNILRMKEIEPNVTNRRQIKSRCLSNA